jgi:AcrR family transcriptional regulator
MAKRTARRSYHHGDLKRALLDAALPLIRKGGPGALTLRAVARAAGVSQTAPYRHFADRNALVAAVADQGFERLHARLLAAFQAPEKITGRKTETARAGLQAIGVAYVQFALDHPDEYRVMFGDEAASGRAPESGAKVFAFLEQGIVMLQKQKLVRDGDAHAIALTAWALVHGLAMLMLDGQLKGKEAPTSTELTVLATELLMFGMARR